VPLLVRTWNVFHGNASPPRRRGYLRDMIELVTADRPGVVALQEVPLWALRHLESWSGMQSIGVIAARPRLGSAELGRWITELHHGLFRSAFTGQGNALLVAQGLRVHDERTLTVSTGGERRVCQSVRVDDIAVFGNFHVTGGAPADEQFLRVAEFVEAQDERVVLAGDANLRPPKGRTYARLREWGFSEPATGIDQILVRGLPATAPVAWPEERRRVARTLLSDHAPVELTVG
jgi:endonuclease/exonuclease/phosphatase family metal-dependent hydrolase